MPSAVTLRLTTADPVPGVAYSLQDKANAPVDPRIAGDGPISFDVPVTLSDDGRLTGPFVRREGPSRRFAISPSAHRPDSTANGAVAPRSTSTTFPPPFWPRPAPVRRLR